MYGFMGSQRNDCTAAVKARQDSRHAKHEADFC